MHATHSVRTGGRKAGPQHTGFTQAAAHLLLRRQRAHRRPARPKLHHLHAPLHGRLLHRARVAARLAARPGAEQACQQAGLLLLLLLRRALRLGGRLLTHHGLLRLQELRRHGGVAPGGERPHGEGLRLHHLHLLGGVAYLRVAHLHLLGPPHLMVPPHLHLLGAPHLMGPPHLHLLGGPHLLAHLHLLGPPHLLWWPHHLMPPHLARRLMARHRPADHHGHRVPRHLRLHLLHLRVHAHHDHAAHRPGGRRARPHGDHVPAGRAGPAHRRWQQRRHARLPHHAIGHRSRHAVGRPVGLGGGGEAA
jgi:hypothetical protein